MELLTKAPKGTVDLVPGATGKWQLVEDVVKSEAELNGFAEIRTPVFEHTELFLRGVGDTTDVVEKQMYTFEDKAGAGWRARTGQTLTQRIQQMHFSLATMRASFILMAAVGHCRAHSPHWMQLSFTDCGRGFDLNSL